MWSPLGQGTVTVSLLFGGVVHGFAVLGQEVLDSVAVGVSCPAGGGRTQFAGR